MNTKSEEETTGPSIGEERGDVRIHVGGLGESVSRDDLLKIFSPMGSVKAVDFVRTKGRSFAYIDFSPSSHNSLTKLFSTYNGCVWKGGKLRLEKAKDHYLVKLRREWDECSDDNTICLPKPPSVASETSHLKIFFPRLRKVKVVPFSGTGKHKYSFQRVEVPSVSKYFCDCEEHSTSHTLQGNCWRDAETNYSGINEEELNIMNSVMNRLFQANHEQETRSLLETEKDNDTEDEEDQDNLVINVVSSQKALSLSRIWDQETVSRKRKSLHNGTQETIEGYTRGKKRNLQDGTRDTREGYPSKLKKSMIHERNGTNKSTLEIPEKNEPSEVDPDKSSVRPGSGDKPPSSSVFRSQKSSWKALIASANNSKFSVSSVLPNIASSQGEHHTSSNSDFVNINTQENLNLKEADIQSMEGSAVKQKSKSKTPRKTGKSLAADTSERNESTPTEANVEAELKELESSVMYSAIDTSFENPSKKEIIIGTDENPIASSLLTNAKDDQFVPEKLDAERDVQNETQNLTVKGDADNYLDEGKGVLESFNRVARGTSWRQKSSWTQLVSETNSSFSITQFFPDLNSQNHEPREVKHADADQRETAVNKSEWTPNEDKFRADAVIEDSVSRNTLDGSQPNHGNDDLTTVTTAECDATKKPRVAATTGIGENCLFVRGTASLKAWADAKRALTEPSKRKHHGRAQ